MKKIPIIFYGYHKTQNLTRSSKEMKKLQNKSPKKVIGRKPLHTVIKVKYFLFFHFSIHNFFAWVCLQLFQQKRKTTKVKPTLPYWRLRSRPAPSLGPCPGWWGVPASRPPGRGRSPGGGPPARSSRSPRRRPRRDCRGTPPLSANRSRRGTSGCTVNE